MPNHPKARHNGAVLTHILVAEQKLNRPLKSEEVVHHLDKNKKNNSVENIVVFINGANHARYHKTGIMEETNEKFVYKSPDNHIRYCIQCGLKISYSNDSKLCFKCYKTKIAEHLPSKEELEKLIYSKSFLAIGKMFGVSDNAVRKWCRKYNLPFKKKDLKR